MKNPDDRIPATRQQLSQQKWKGAQSIGLAQQLNEQFIELCCELSLDTEFVSPFPLIALHRDLWRRLDSVSRKRLSLFPFVIVDLRFRDAAWWRLVACLEARMHRQAAGAAPATRWEWFALETLMFGWQVAREDQSVASMLFAMSPPVAECIAALTMQQVRMLAVESAKSLRIRWDNDQRFWRELLIAAREQNAIALEGLRIEAKLHFCGELIHAQSVDCATTPLIAGDRTDAAQEHRR
jgi:hypothetical protein